ncbi:MAG: hypothetical protein LBT08_06410 [Synergistaceae bacterium]|nr:hypothetical protein [Synergistaceae bacterium]
MISMGKYLRGRRPAFSLIAVLVLAMIGLALVGGVMYSFGSFSASSRSASSRTMEYNLVQEGVERGKATLKEIMTKTGRTQAVHYNKGITTINDCMNLLIYDETASATMGHVVVDQSVKANGLNGVLNVYIFDMEYNPAAVDGSLSDAQKAALNLPPASSINGGSSLGLSDHTTLDPDDPATATTVVSSTNAGVYLVRAVFEKMDDRGDRTGERRTIETAVLQATQ